MMQQVLFNTKSNTELAEKGYTIVDFLNSKQVKSLFDFYIANPNVSPSAFHTTHFHTDLVYKQRVQQFIFDTLRRNFEQHFVFHQPVFANFMVKEGAGNNSMPLHADWTYVDESKSSSYAIWIPLVDTNTQNGCIGVIPFSHYLSYPIRGPRILQWTCPTEEILIEKLGKLFPMQTGQALIYNHRTLHYSMPNESNHLRPSINVSLTPKDEPIIHYTMPEGEKEVIKFKVTNDFFFLDYNNFQMPKHGTMLEKVIPESIPLLNERVKSFLTKYETHGILSYLKKLFA